MKHLFSRYISIVALFLFFFAFNVQAQAPATGTLYIVGSATPGGWSNPIPDADTAAQRFTQISTNEYKIDVLLIGGNEYKFISVNGSWTNNWGIAKADDPTEVNGGPLTFNSNNILAPSVSGVYTIDVNFAANIFTVKLVSKPKVTISSFSPTLASTGTTVTIHGGGFTGATAVSFGGTAATSFAVVNDSTITAVVSIGSSGTVQVTSPSGVGVSAGFTYNSNTLFIVGNATPGGWNNPIPPVDSALQQFTTISPTEYKITIELMADSSYKFITVNGSWTVNYGISVKNDPTEINGGAIVSNGNDILAPATTGTYVIDVNLATNTFTVTPLVAPTVSIYSFAPTSAGSGDTVLIKGVGFSGTTAVGFGGMSAASFVVLNDSTITAIVDTGASGSVQVIAPKGTVSLAGFVYNAKNQTGFIVGSAVAGGWNNPIPSVDSVAQQFIQVGPNELKITIHLMGGGEYKFIPQDGSWATSYGIAVQDDPTEIYGGAFITNGQNILAPPLSGVYAVDINTKAKTYTVTLVSPDTLFILGSATANGWNNPLQTADSAAQQFTKVSPTEYMITVFLAGDSSYKLIARDGDWTYNWGITNSNDTSMVYSGTLLYGTQSKDILAPHVSGNYTIDVNFATGAFTVISTQPVTLASFSATASSKTILANWHTSTELSTSSFAVQHSTGGVRFTTIGTVKAAGSGANNYQFADNNPTNGINYYRLQTMDKSGAVAYSKVVAVRFTVKATYAVYPTLIHNGTVSIAISDAVAGKAIVRIIDLNGRTLQTGTINIANGTNVLPYKINGTAKGNYILQVETATDKQAFKVIVE